MLAKRDSAMSDKKVRWAKRLTSIASLKGFSRSFNVDNTGLFLNQSVNDHYDEFTWARVLNTKLEIENGYKLWSQSTVLQQLQNLTSDLEVQLFTVVSNGRLDLLESICTQSDNVSNLVNSCDSIGRSLLHVAVFCDLSEIVAYLLQKGAIVECWDMEKIATPLICACAKGNLKMIEVLIAHGANVNANSEDTGRSPLHWAVSSGQVECVQKLIKHGACEVVSHDPGNISPFLLAAMLGHDEILHVLVRNGADLSSVLGNTCDSALHISAIMESVACTKVLLEAGILPDVRNIYGETPLHLADTIEVATLLLSKGANMNAAEINGLTPLHFAVLRGNGFLNFLYVLPLISDFLFSWLTSVFEGNINVEKTKFLISQGADVNAQNDRGETPVFLASTQGTPMKVCHLLSNGANITVKNIEGVDSYAVMKVKMPHVIPGVQDSLDQAIAVVANDPSDLNCMVSMDFSTIGMEAEKEIRRSRSRNRNSKIVDMSSEDFEANLKVRQPKNSVLVKTSPFETEFLQRLVVDGHKEMLAHPLIQAFLELKWGRARYIFYANFAFYILMAVLYTIFTMESFMKACPHYSNNPTYIVPAQSDMVQIWSWFNVVPQRGPIKVMKADSSFVTGISSSINMAVEKIIKCDITWQIVVVWCLLILATFGVMMKEILKIAQERKKYFKAFENVGEWIFIFSILGTSVWGSWTPCNCNNISDWHYPTAAVGLLICWTMVLVRIGKFPRLGLYVQMLGKVLKNFGRFLLVYISILNAFALAFCVIFPKEPAFASYPLAMLKVFTMMTGEMGYDDLFYGEYQDHLSSRRQGMGEPGTDYYNLRNSKDKTTSTLSILALIMGSNTQTQEQQLRFESNLFYRICTSHLLYCLFIAVVSISLMNLLVALAVNDIQDLQCQARVERLRKQAMTIFSLERFVFSRFVTSLLPKPITNWFRRIILLHGSTQRCKFTIRPNDPNDTSISDDLKKKIMEIAVKSFDANGGVSSTLNKSFKTKAPAAVSLQESLKNEPEHSLGKIVELQDLLESLQQQVDTLSKTLVGQLESVQESLNTMKTS